MALELYVGAVGTTPASLLMIRQSGSEQHSFAFMCTGSRDSPWAYYFTLNAVVSTICAGFGYGVEYTGRTQVIERFGFNDIHNRRIRVVFQYTWNVVKWGSATSCSTAITYGLGNYCQVRTRLFCLSLALWSCGQFQTWYEAGNADMSLILDSEDRKQGGRLCYTRRGWCGVHVD